MDTPKPPNWQETFPGMPKLPDMKRFQRTFQGFQGGGQGMWGKFAKYNSNMWNPIKGNNNGKQR